MNRTKVTFAFLALACLAGAASAQFIGRTVTVAQLGSCNGTRQVAVVTDATNATTLGAGGGNATVWVTCATGSWTIAEIAAVSDLSAYLPVSGTTAAPIVIQNSGAGNDVSAIALDDLFLTPGDALTAVAGGNVTLTSTAGTLALASSAGAITATAVGATNDITLTAADDVILAATDDTTVAGDNVSVSSSTISLNPGASTVELALAAGSSTFLGSLILPIASAPPAACAAGTKGTIYYDSDANVLCVCDATSYKLVADQSSTTGCS